MKFSPKDWTNLYVLLVLQTLFWDCQRKWKGTGRNRVALYAISRKIHEILAFAQSQEILNDNAEELRIKLKWVITHDFYMELLSFGENVKVIQPKSVVNRVKATVENVLKWYE